MTDIDLSFDSDEQVSDILVDVSGAETGSLTEADFTEAGTGPFSYSATYTASATSGDVTFTLETAADAAGNDGAGGETTTVTLASGLIDGFEDGDLNEYTGDVSYFAATTAAPVSDGSFSLKSTGSDDNTRRNIVSTSGLGTYPSAGDTFQVKVQSTEISTANKARNCGFLFFAQDTSNGYYIQLDGANDVLKLFEKDGGNFVELANTSANWSQNTWYVFEVATTAGGGSIDVTVTEAGSGASVASLSGSSSLYTTGGIGFGSTYSTLAADTVQIL